ncbi:isopentenyl-diphosphate Delta-isomerase [Alishewanella tabrizica]|uniref:Isopentenyl-diphosphate Delta-isomerase n=1 Tax=Alishewanella tabrizica TaxID=671278 RepID=A0ABQ2WGY5_9ALTE|nr:isopentenyl-diphosphate Delta-isomerase [Alishewanella tabrizica]GGW51875.1 isopentenyl-diphosphate Delta-isomerase [Alishewanella tabrizica]
MHTYSPTIDVPLVDSNGTIIGYSEKMHVHREGLLHLAFSLMIIRQRPTGVEYLLQRRAEHKYHSGGLWTNTCCSHPLMNESINDAAQRRVNDELGIVTPLVFKNVAKILYYLPLDRGLVEHEYNHVLVAMVDDVEWSANVDEVMSVQWWSSQQIVRQLSAHPNTFTAWFPEVFRHVSEVTIESMS